VSDHRDQPARRTSLLRLLAAALAGGIGAFGIPAVSHASTPPVITPPSVSAPDTTPH
jgi:hypothetical protein